MKQADLAKRFVAYMIDSFALSTLINIILIPFYCVAFLPMALIDNSVGKFNSSDAAVILMMCCIGVVFFALMITVTYFYYIWLPVKKWGGATIGKRVMGITVMRSSGANATQSDLFIREIIGKFISGAVFYLGFIWILVDEKNRGWHDMIADTIVVESKEKVL
jgi:uncharacterized RDD family membrane protein YckC